MKSKKKLFLGLVIIFIIIILLLLTVSKKNSGSNELIKTTIKNSKTTDTNIINSSTQLQSNGTLYKGVTYDLYYPKNWTKEIATDNKGTVISILPDTYTKTVSPHIIFQVADARQTTIKDMSAAYTLFGYTKTTASVAGIAAQRYSIVMNTKQGVLHSIAYIFETGGNIYLMKLGYKKEVTDIQLEQQFTEIVNAFSLQ